MSRTHDGGDGRCNYVHRFFRQFLVPSDLGAVQSVLVNNRKTLKQLRQQRYEGNDQGEQFELYALYDADESYGVDVEVWQDGDTDVFLTLFRPTTDIVDMLPGS